jgi:hypothetical protein
MADVKYRKLIPNLKLVSRSQSSLRLNSTSRAYHSTAATERQIKANLSQRISPKKTLTALTSVRTRARKKIDDEITPQGAASIIRSYILPLFEADHRQNALAQRTAERGLGPKFFGAEGSTLYADLKLSGRLADEVTDLRRLNHELTQQVKQRTQSKASYKLSLTKLKAKSVSTESSLEASNRLVHDLQGQLQSSALLTSQLSHELSELKDLYRAEKQELVDLKDKYIAVLKQLEGVTYSHLLATKEKEMVQMQQTIALDNLQTLRQIMDEEALTAKAVHEKSLVEKMMLTKDFSRQVQWVDYLGKEYERMHTTRRAEQMSLAMLNGAFSNISSQRAMAIKTLTAKHAQLTTSYVEATKDNSDLREKLKEQGRRYESLTKEFRSLWSKHSQLARANRSSSERCRRCERMYVEDDNFNWSCRVHTSTFEAFWLCCGKTAKSSQGCSTSKHVPLSEIEKLGLGGETRVMFREKCNDCKVYGHTSKDCPNDPNRVFNFEQAAQKGEESKANLTEDSLRILRSKLGDVGMTHDLSSPSSSSQASNDDRPMDKFVNERLRNSMKIKDVIARLTEKRTSLSYDIKVLPSEEDDATLPTFEGDFK